MSTSLLSFFLTEYGPYLLAVGATVLLWHLLTFRLVWRRIERLSNAPFMISAPQGPSFPFIGQALNFVKMRPWDLLNSWHQVYGPIVGFPLLGTTMFSLGSPHLIKMVCQSKTAAVKKDIHNTMKPFLVILGKGIVSSEDQAWLQQRLKMSKPLREDVLEIIPMQTLRALKRLFQKFDRAVETGGTVPIGSSLRHLTLQVISGTFLSLTAEESDSTFAKLYLPIVDESNARVWHPYRSYLICLPAFWKQLWNVYRLNQYVSQLIRKRFELRQKERGSIIGDRDKDILDLVLQVYEKEFPDATIISEVAVRQLRDEMKTFMLAGHETSAAMMTWAIYELIGESQQSENHDGGNMIQRVLQEADSVFDKSRDWSKATTSDLPAAPDLKKLVYSEATLRESLRKYSVVPTVARIVISDLHMPDEENKTTYVIPKGSSILINMQTVHHDPQWWPEPFKFDPTRFLGDGPPTPYTFLPFIAGPRNCLGQHLALLESKMVISMMTQRYKFTVANGKRLCINDWASDNDPRHRYMVPVIPAQELEVTVVKRTR